MDIDDLILNKLLDSEETSDSDKGFLKALKQARNSKEESLVLGAYMISLNTKLNILLGPKKS